MNNSKNKKKKGSGGLWALIALAVLFFNLLGEADSGELRYVLWRLRHVDPTVVIAIVTVVIAVAIAGVAFAAKKARAAESKPVSRAAQPRPAAQHSHDRIQGYTGSEDGYEHWKKQLDGFLAAGLIDRKEYMALLERRRDSYWAK